MNITNLDFERALSRIRDRYIQLPPHQQRILVDRISQSSQEQLLVEVNEPLPVQQGRGRPVGTRGRRGKGNISTRRDPTAFEHVLNQTEVARHPDAVSVV